MSWRVMVVFRLFALACCLALISCAGPVRSSLDGPELALDLSARRPIDRFDASSGGAVPADRSVGRSWSLGPTQPVATADISRTSALEEVKEGQAGSYKLNFDRAEIRDVVRAVLNDSLGLNYTMGADVSGRVTISSARPLNRAELLAALENILAGQGLTMTNSGGIYKIAPTAVAGGAVDVDAGEQPGYGVSIVPLRFVSAAMMGRLIPGFVAEADRVRIDTARNALIVRGPGAKREETVQTILAFDADWMRGQLVSVFEVRRARPEAVVSELSQIFDAGENGASTGLIQFKPISRLKAVLAVSKNPALMKRAEAFIRRLDGQSEGTAENVFIYRARYHDAKELARVVSSLFGAGGDARGPGGPTGLGDKGGRGLAPSPGGFGAADGTLASSASSLGGKQAVSPTPATSMSARFAAAFNDKGGLGGGDAPPGAPDVIDLTRKEAGGTQRISISADASNNSVITYADGETYRKIHAALRQLDSAPLQVAVNVIIAEVQLNDQLRFGVQHFITSDTLRVGKDRGSFGLFSQAANVLSRQLPGFNFLVGASATPDVIISALDSITDVKILSSPSLVVSENKTAALQVGDAIPITTRQAQSVELPNAPVINQIEFRDTGIILNVTPRIGQNDAVTMQIEQEISSVTRSGDTLTPTISKRKVGSNISVVSGQTVLLAGLISDKSEKGRSAIPVLGRIPVLGDIVGETSRGYGRTELVVFIRPVVIHDSEDAQSVAEEFRARLRTAPIEPLPLAAKRPLVLKR